MRTRQALGLGQIEHRDRCRGPVASISRPSLDIDAAGRVPGRPRSARSAPGRRAPQLVGEIAADRVVDADDRRGARGLMRKNAPFGGDIPVHPAMPVEMVRGDVEQHRDVEGERVDQLELERAQLRAHRCRRCRAAPATAPAVPRLPPISTRRPALAEDVADQRRRRRFAVGAGDADIARLGLCPAEQLDVADDLRSRPRGRAGPPDAARDSCAGCLATGPARRCPRQSACGEVAERDLAGDRVARRGIVVPGEDLGAAGGERAGRRRGPSAPAPARRRGDRRSCRSMRRDASRAIAVSGSPARRSPGSTAMIQKRITIVGSSQPFCSK